MKQREAFVRTKKSKRAKRNLAVVAILALSATGIWRTTYLLNPPRIDQPHWFNWGVLLRKHLPEGCYDCPGSMSIDSWLGPRPFYEMDQLRGRVHINNPDDALAFCRFGDYNAAYPLKGDQHVEIEEITYPGAHQVVSGNGMTSDLWEASGAKKPAVRRGARGWIIERAVIIKIPDQREPKPFNITEIVGDDGAYVITKKMPLRVPPSKGNGFYFQMLG